MLLYVIFISQRVVLIAGIGLNVGLKKKGGGLKDGSS